MVLPLTSVFYIFYHLLFNSNKSYQLTKDNKFYLINYLVCIYYPILSYVIYLRSLLL